MEVEKNHHPALSAEMVPLPPGGRLRVEGRNSDVSIDHRICSGFTCSTCRETLTGRILKSPSREALSFDNPTDSVDRQSNECESVEYFRNMSSIELKTKHARAFNT